ncbi:MAG: tetratricopeptide repeat protein, partial [Bacteroidota bacterium]
GAILLRNGDRSGARMHLERALDADPEDTTSLYNLAGLHAMESRPTEAREALNRLLVLEPNHPDARRLMASIEG